MIRISAVFLIVLMAAACAQMVNYYASNVSIRIDKADIRNKASFDKVDLDVDLSIKNDNLFPVYITGFTYNVLIGKSIVASGKNPDNESFMVKEKNTGKLSFSMSIRPKRAGQEFIKAYLDEDAEMKIYGKVYATSDLGNFTFNYSRTHKLKK
ncbi:MAG: LEA type 2 family protein [Deferribacterales bacterium]